MTDLKIGVVGCGVVGLTSALELQKTFKNAQIDIVAEKFHLDTTSAVAAGLFRPGTTFSGPTEDTAHKWIKDAYRYWEDIVQSGLGPMAGVSEVSGYVFSSENVHVVRNAYLEKLVPLYRAATEKELKLCPGNWKYGSFFTTFQTECSVYLPWAMDKFKAGQGRIIEKRITSLPEIATEYDIVVNCTGMGARTLCNDKKLIPVRGQVIKVKAPWIKTFFYGDYDTYVIPGFDIVTLGGCRHFESYDLQVDLFDAFSIRHRCQTLVPSLKSAKEVSHMVGLRPHRDPVRVEKESGNYRGKRVRLVHNYGHGGYGVTSAPGTALHACQLVRESLMGNSKL